MPVKIRKITVELEPISEVRQGYLGFTLRIDLHNNRPPLFARNMFPANDFKSNLRVFLDMMLQEIEVKLERQFTIERREEELRRGAGTTGAVI
jgi:hypothetical protein